MFRHAFATAARRPTSSWAQVLRHSHPMNSSCNSSGRRPIAASRVGIVDVPQARASSTAAAYEVSEMPTVVVLPSSSNLASSSSDVVREMEEGVREYGERSKRGRSTSPGRLMPRRMPSPDAANLLRRADELEAQEAAMMDKVAPPPYSILFFGMDSMSIPTLEALVQDLHSPGDTQAVRHLEVVRPHSLRKGFREPTKLLEGIRVHTAPKGNLKGWKVPLTPEGKPFDLAVVVSFGYFLPAKVIESFPLGVINMHPSMLPKYRGASPVATALMNGDSSSGVSIVNIRPREVMDSGAILVSRAARLESQWTYADAERCLGNLGAQAMLHALREFPIKSQLAAEQPESEVTLTKKIDTTTRGLRFTQQTSSQVFNLWRSLTEFGFPFAVFRDAEGKECRMVFRVVAPASSVFETLHPARVRDTKCQSGKTQTSRPECSERRQEQQARIVDELLSLAPDAPPGSIYFARHNGNHNVAFVRCASKSSPQTPYQRDMHGSSHSVDRCWVAVRELSVQGRGILTPERWRQWAKIDAGVLYSPSTTQGNYFVDAPIEN